MCHESIIMERWGLLQNDIQQSVTFIYRPDPTWLVIFVKMKDGRKFYKTILNPKPYKPKYKLEL